jgi:hypothetical protein
MGRLHCVARAVRGRRQARAQDVGFVGFDGGPGQLGHRLLPGHVTFYAVSAEADGLGVLGSIRKTIRPLRRG